MPALDLRCQVMARHNGGSGMRVCFSPISVIKNTVAAISRESRAPHSTVYCAILKHGRPDDEPNQHLGGSKIGRGS